MNTSFNALKLAPAGSAARAPGSNVPSRLAAWGAAVWQTLEAIGRSRARRELLTLADRWESSRPELAAQLRAAGREPRRA